MATVALNITGHDQSGPSFRSAVSNMDTLGTSIDRLKNRVTALGGAFLAYFAADKLVAGFAKGIEAVDDFQQSVVKTAAMITSLQGGENVAENYRKAKVYAEGLQNVLMRVDANTTLNLSNLQAITEEMLKQGVVLDGNNAQQVEGFTRLANAVAVYSNNGRNEIQVRQEVSALLRGEVDQNSQLASMLQKTVQGPLQQWVDKHKQAGDLMQALGEKLAGFGPASQDLATTWGAVKSSLETSVSLILRAGFSAIVKDLVEWLGKANEYLKSHADLIGNEIKKGWEEFKKIAEFLVPVIKEMYEHASLFVGLFVGGALIKGLTSAYGLYKDIRTVVREIALIQTVGAVAGAAGTGAGAAGAAVGAGEVAAGGAAVGWLAKARALPGLKYLLNPVTAALAAGAWVMRSKDANEMDDVAKINAYKPNTVASAAAGAPAPKITLSDSPEQTKRKMDLMSKELAAFKEMEESKSAIAKAQSEVQLTVLKGQYDQGLVSTREYYEQEKKLALDAAQKKFDNASEYLDKEQKLLEFIQAKKGTKSPEYQEELVKNRKAQEMMQTAALDYAKTSTDLNNKETEALKKRSEEYGKLQITALDAAGRYEEAAQKQIELDKQGIEYLRLKTEAMRGEQGAAEALAAWEQKRSVDIVTAHNKEAEALRTLAAETRTLQNEWDAIVGKDQARIDAENALVDGQNKLILLQERLALATAQGNLIAVAALEKEIALQRQLNELKERSTQIKLAQSDQAGVLSGSIVGFNGNTPIYAKGSESGGYDNGIAVPAYQSYRDAEGRASGGWTQPYTTYRINEDGTEYLTMGSKGGYITPAGKTPPTNTAAASNTYHFHGDIILPNVTNQTTARELFAEFQKLARRQAA